MIEGVAVRFQHQGAVIEVRLPKPARHCDCFKYAGEILKLPVGSHHGSENQGFYDRLGRYLDRKEAMTHVRMTGQNLLPMSCGRVNMSPRLFSEDLW
jgi:hypothetical protein